MDRNQAKKFYPILQAFAEGKAIECRTRVWELNKGWKYSTTWKETEELKFQDTYEYRIKPEVKYRPFKNAEECWEEMQKHQPFGWMKCKDNSIPGKFMYITNVRDNEVAISLALDISYSELIKYYTFTDGTPLGVKIEQ